MNKFRVLLVICSFILGSFVVVQAIDEDTNIEGRVAIVGQDYNVYTYDFSDGESYPVSDDASTTNRYQWPTWSLDGRLAYFCCDWRATSSLNSAAYVSSDGIAPGELVYEGQDETIIYANWSPSSCSGDADCRDLALLINEIGEGTLSVELLHNSSQETTQERIDIGSPFYYQWSYDGAQLIFHRYSRQLDIFSVTSSDITENIEEPSSGLYQAPAWSPVDDRILFGWLGSELNRTDLVVYENGAGRILAEDLEGFLSFLWSPDGNMIAYRLISPQGHGNIVVLDAQTGEEISSTVDENIISFVWSPDSQKIAYVTAVSSDDRQAKQGIYARPLLVQNQDVPIFTWSVLSVSTSETTRYNSFVPTYEMGYWMLYFDQFTPSHRIWSPDSRYLVYSRIVDLTTNSRPVISLLDTTGPSSTTVTDIRDGVFAVWSFE